MKPQATTNLQGLSFRLTSLRSSAENLRLYLHNLPPTSEPLLRYAAAMEATSEFLSLMTEVASALLLATEHYNSTNAFIRLRNLRELLRGWRDDLRKWEQERWPDLPL